MADAATAAPPAPAPVEEVVDIDLTDPQVGEAAKKIQSAFRIKKKTATTGSGPDGGQGAK